MNQTMPFGRALGILLIVDAAILFSVIGRVPLARIDEGQIAEVSREMAVDRDWLTPRLGGVTFAPYPPVGYWLFASSGSVFGFNEFAMRVPTALAALALIAVTAFLGRRLAGPEAGLAAGAILATIPVYFIQSIVCRADIMLMLCATAAFERFLAWAEGGKKHRDLALMYLYIALGFMTKGLLAIGILGLGGLTWFVINRQWKLLLEMKFWIGIPAAILIVVPWYYAMYRIHGPQFIKINLFLENLEAYRSGYKQKREWFFYFRQTPLLLPWLLVLPLAAKVRRSPGVLLSVSWFLLIGLFLTISSSKRINYMVYFCPPLAAAAATTFTALCTDAPQVLRKAILGLGGVLTAGGIILAALPARIWTGGSVSKMAGQFTVIGVLGAAVALAIAGIAWKRGPRLAGAAIAIVLALSQFVYGFFIQTKLSPENLELVAFCRRAASKVPPGEKLCIPPPGGVEGLVHFYAGATLPVRPGEPGFYIAGQSQHDQFVKEGKKLQVLDSLEDERGRNRYLLRIDP